MTHDIGNHICLTESCGSDGQCPYLSQSSIIFILDVSTHSLLQKCLRYFFGSTPSVAQPVNHPESDHQLDWHLKLHRNVLRITVKHPYTQRRIINMAFALKKYKIHFCAQIHANRFVTDKAVVGEFCCCIFQFSSI